MKAKRYYLFDLFRVDVYERVLYCAESVVPLTPKAFDTLLVLIEHNGHVLGKNELMEKVWPDTFVEENNLAQNISMLRKALSRGGRKFIETVPKRGYRFVADVKESLNAAEANPEATLAGKTRAAHEQPHRKGNSFLKDVIIIGRAVVK
ncbi:MAG: transcriptional regulator [Pyrinomonadaceae bacterium]|nr:transcriptional regulator [Pyrinomonadaceae bacterium]